MHRYGIVDQTSIVANIAKTVVLYAGAWACGENVACLFFDLVFAPPNPAPPAQPRRGRRHPG